MMLHTLRGKFLAFIVLPVLSALLALTAISYFSARHYLLRQMEKSGLDALKADAEDMSRIVVRMRTVLESLAIAEQQGGFDDAQRRQIFLRLRERMGDTATSLFMGFPDGRMVRSKDTPLPGNYDPRNRPWYTRAMALPPDVPYGGTPPYGDASTGGTVVTLFHKVSTQGGTLVGILGVDIDVARMAGTLKERAGLTRDGIRFIVSEEGMVLVHPDAARVNTLLSHSAEPMDIRTAELIRDPQTRFHQAIGRRAGGQWYMGFHKITGTRAYIVLMMPAETVLQPLTRLIRVMSLLAAVFIVIIVTVMLVMTRRISQPVFALTEAAVKVVAEDRYQNPLAVRSRDELGRLTEAFNSMMDGLRQRDFIRDTFGRYVAKEVVETLLDRPDGLRLGGEKREVTIMFCDIRGFTPLSESLDPEQVVGILNRYLGTMSAIVARHGGTVSEFMGDALLAFFGAPVAHADSPLRAVVCAVEMQRAMTAFNRDNAQTGLPELGMGIGINTGEVIVGNIGSEHRAKYGVVGHEINLTARVEAATAGGQILITGATLEKAQDHIILRGEQHKGVEGPVTLYDVDGVTIEQRLMVPDLAENAVALAAPVEVRVTCMKDKRETGTVIQGRLTHFSTQWVRVVLAETIGQATEVRIDLNPDPQDAAETLYARVVESRPSDQGVLHLLRLSYVSPEAGKRINP